MAAKIFNHTDSIESISRGINQAANTVKHTLGPKGRNTIYDQQYDIALVLNDGVSIVKQVEFNDPVENAAANILKDAAIRTDQIAGDGTTSTILLIQNIFEEGKKLTEAGVNPILLRKGMEKAAAIAVNAILDHAIEVDSREKIKMLATASSNNEEIGELMADAFEKIGKNGFITVEDSQLPETTMEFFDGMKFDRGLKSKRFATAPNGICTLENPCILLLNRKLANIEEILPLLEEMQKKGKSLLIIVKDIDDALLNILAQNTAQGMIKCAVVEGPGYGDTRSRHMSCMAAMLGTVVIHEQNGIRLQDLNEDYLGHAKRAVIDAESTVIQGASCADSSEAKQLRKWIKGLIAAETKDYELEKLNESLNLLNNKTLLIKAGGITEYEMFEIKYRIEKARNCVCSAITSGIVPGGGKSFLLASEAVKSFRNKLEGDEKYGADVLLNALNTPLKQIAENAGTNGNVVLHNVQENPSPFYGYNAKNGCYGNLMDAGILDSAQTTICALTNAVSAASTLLTAGAMICRKS